MARCYAICSIAYRYAVEGATVRVQAEVGDDGQLLILCKELQLQ